MVGVTPFLSPLIIGGLSAIVLPQAFKFAGKKIQIGNDKIQEYKRQGGVKGLLASIASPCLSVLSKCIPPDTDLHAILTDSKKLHQFFNDLLNNTQKRKEFEESLEKFLTSKYESSNEFLATIKEAFGLDDVGVALDVGWTYLFIFIGNFFDFIIKYAVWTIQPLNINPRKMII